MAWHKWYSAQPPYHHWEHAQPSEPTRPPSNPDLQTLPLSPCPLIYSLHPSTGNRVGRCIAAAPAEPEGTPHDSFCAHGRSVPLNSRQGTRRQAEVSGHSHQPDPSPVNIGPRQGRAMRSPVRLPQRQRHRSFSPQRRRGSRAPRRQLASNQALCICEGGWPCDPSSFALTDSERASKGAPR